MALNPSDLTIYSWADIKKACMQAMAQGVLVQAMSEPGRSVTFGSVAEARDTYKWACEMEQIEQGQVGGVTRLISRRY